LKQNRGGGGRPGQASPPWRALAGAGGARPAAAGPTAACAGAQRQRRVGLARAALGSEEAAARLVPAAARRGGGGAARCEHQRGQAALVRVQAGREVVQRRLAAHGGDGAVRPAAAWSKSSMETW